MAATIEALRDVGFSGTSAREIARRAGCNQGLVFYHFGSVTNLLLAALDEVSALRLATVPGRGGAGPEDLSELVETAETVFEEDLDAGYISVLAEMIAGASSTPGLGVEVAATELAVACLRRRRRTRHPGRHPVFAGAPT